MSPEADVCPMSQLIELLAKPVSLAIIEALVPGPLAITDLTYKALARGLLDFGKQKTRVLIILNDLERIGVVEAHDVEIGSNSYTSYNLTPFYLNDVKAAILKHYFG